MTSRANRLELLKRLVWIQGQMVLGKRDADLVLISSQKYQITIRQSQKYIKMAYTRFERSQSGKTAAQKGKLINMAQEAWSLAIAEDKKDYGAIAKILRELSRLTGVDPGDIIRGELTLNHKTFTDMVKEGEIERDKTKKSGQEGTRIPE